MRLVVALMYVLLLAPAPLARASDGAAGVVQGDAAATLPTGEDARPRAAVLSGRADLPASSDLLQEGLGGYRALSFSPGPLRLSSRFGLRDDPLGRHSRFHAGVDIPARVGAAVRAVRAGRVVFAGWAGGYGNLVVIDHGAQVRTRYGHLERALVEAGDRVGAGTQIGNVGSTGRSTGPHLHYEVRIAGVAIDPLRAAMNIRENPAWETGAAVPAWRDWEPGSEASAPEAVSRWFWQGADQMARPADELPAPVIR